MAGLLLVVLSCIVAFLLSGLFVRKPESSAVVTAVTSGFASAQVLFFLLGFRHPVRGYMIGLIYTAAILIGYGVWTRFKHHEKDVAADGTPNDRAFWKRLAAGASGTLLIVAFLNYLMPQSVGAAVHSLRESFLNELVNESDEP